MTVNDLPNFDFAINLDNLFSDANDYLEAANVFRIYSDYCTLQFSAQTMRRNGQIAASLLIENKMITLYKSLPTWAKW